MPMNMALPTVNVLRHFQTSMVTFNLQLLLDMQIQYRYMN